MAARHLPKMRCTAGGAPPGEVLIGEPTLALVGDPAEVEWIEPFALKRKAEPVARFRLLREPGRGFASPSLDAPTRIELVHAA